jgi:hypothetical protein
VIIIGVGVLAVRVMAHSLLIGRNPVRTLAVAVFYRMVKTVPAFRHSAKDFPSALRKIPVLSAVQAGFSCFFTTACAAPYPDQGKGRHKSLRVAPVT